MNSGGLSPRPYFRRRLTDEQVSAALTLLQSYATVTQLTVEVRGVATPRTTQSFPPLYQPPLIT